MPNHVIRKLELMLAAIIILAALLASITRLMTPVLNEHRADFEKLASRLLQMPVIIQSVEVRWHGYSPEISLASVTILEAETLKPKLNIQRFEIDFSIWRTLLDRQVFVRNMTIAGMKLNITQGALGQVQIGELASINVKDSLTGSSVQTDKSLEWIFSQARLALEDIDIKYTYADKPERSITLDSLALINQGDHHTVDGRAILNQALPIKTNVSISWDGDVRKMEQAKGHFYAYLEGLELAQWFSKMSWANVQVKSGLASIKVWGNWENDHWQKFQSQFQVYGLKLYSEMQKRTETLDRISGNIGWRRDGNTQTISGDQVYIDFPYHLWPATSFTIKLFSDANHDLVLNTLKFNYLNLNEALQVATLADGIISADLRQQLMALQPTGELTDLHASADEGKDLMDYHNTDLGLSFSGLTLKTWQQFPGFTNLKGIVVWDKTKGNLKITSDHAFFAFDQMFTKPLYFDTAIADIDAELKTGNEWLVTAKNISLSNADWQATTKFSIDTPEGESPKVDLSTDFIINDVTHLVNYLPDKTLDPDLKKYLQMAIKRSQPMPGKLIINGKLKDFPFEDPASGKFLASLQLNDLDFDYAPGWPLFTHVNGDLAFAGRAMTVTIKNGQLGAVPVDNIVAMIPFIGDAQPQILHVDGAIHNDLTRALDFIHASPLQATLGKDLSNLHLQGGMQLKIGLVIPVRHPDNTTVNAAVGITNAVLTLPQWQVMFNKMNGEFQFTEKSLAASNITGDLQGVPATLSITTLPASARQVSQVRADITSSTSVAALETWMHASLAKFAQGSAVYQLQILLTPHAAKGTGNELILTSDMKGIAINLPAPYGKQAPDVAPLQLNLYTNETDALKSKLIFNQQIAAAVTLDTANKAMKFTSGEIRLGGGAANWQTSPGLVLSGKLKELNVEKWQDYIASVSDGTASADNLKLIRAVDLSTGLLEIMNQQLHAVRFQLSQNKEDWQVKIASNEFGGAITVPFDLEKQPVQADLLHININPSAKQSKQQIDPRKLPSIDLACEDTHIDGVDLGHLLLDIQHTNNGLRIMQFKLNDALYNLDATGEWTQTNGRYRSHLEGQMTSPKVSDLMAHWGVSSANFIGSNGTIKFDLDWPDAPYALSMKNIKGLLTFDLGKGRIVELSESSNAKIGLGRMLNIFSLSTLSRRLRLDFSDMTQKGYSFDYMRGDFTLDQGNAITDNMRIEGPIARADIKGRIGLVAKDFNMSLSITPYVTGSLPVLAAFAGGPIVGVAALVVDKVVSSSVSHVITYKYNITGPWMNPTWTPIKATQQKKTEKALPHSPNH